MVQPPYEFFLSAKDKRKAWTQRLESLKQGDIIYASVVKVTSAVRLMVKPLCTAEPVHSYLADIPIKVSIKINHKTIFNYIIIFFTGSYYTGLLGTNATGQAG